MKFSLISATSIVALTVAGVGPAHATLLSSAPGQSNLYDLVHDGMTSADGGDRTVPKVDPMISAVSSLETVAVGWRQVSSTGPIDRAPNTAIPRVPLAAAPGTRPDDDFATPISGAWKWNATQKALALGISRIAPLIGTIGNAPLTGDKANGTVFIAEGSRPGFVGDGDGRSSSVAVAFAPSSTSTATITVAGAGKFRQQGDGGYSVAANSLQAVPPASDPAPASIVLSDAAQPTLGYSYEPGMSTTKGNAVEASFSDAITATGNFAQLAAPVTIQTSEPRPGTDQPGRGVNAKIQTSEVQPGAGQPGRVLNGKIQTSELQPGRSQPGRLAGGKVQTSELQAGRGQPGPAGTDKIETSQLQPGQGLAETAASKLLTSEVGSAGARSEQFPVSDAAVNLARFIDLTQPLAGKTAETREDGTGKFLSASVAANPSTATALYMANVVSAVRATPSGQTVEAFQVGPSPGTPARGSSGASVADPIRGKIMASAGPLNNSLALP